MLLKVIFRHDCQTGTHLIVCSDKLQGKCMLQDTLIAFMNVFSVQRCVLLNILIFDLPFKKRRGRVNCTLPTASGLIKWFGYQYSVIN